jgi:hypothetical protein
MANLDDAPLSHLVEEPTSRQWAVCPRKRITLVKRPRLMASHQGTLPGRIR